MAAIETDTGSGWLRRQHEYAKSGVVFTEGQVRCLETLASFSTLYNLDIIGKNQRPDYGFRINGDRVDVSLRRSLATYDFGELTSLVIAAHRFNVRVELAPRTVMVDLRDMDVEIDPYVMDPDCDHEEWGWGGCDCSVWPVSVINIGLNARRTRAASEHRWDWHPGLDQLNALTSSSPVA